MVAIRKEVEAELFERSTPFLLRDDLEDENPVCRTAAVTSRSREEH
jgi:hypothetical protein